MVELRSVQPYVWISLAAVVFLALVSGIARAAAAPDSHLTGKVASAVSNLIASAVRSASQAEQDVKPIQQLADAQFGLAYVNSSRLIAGSDDALEALTSTKIDELHVALRAQQRAALQSIAKLCPSLAMSQTYTGSM